MNLDDQNRALWLAARRLGGGQSISVSAIPAAQLSSICTVAPADMAVAVAAVDMQRIGNFFCLDTLGMESAFRRQGIMLNVGRGSALDDWASMKSSAIIEFLAGSLDVAPTQNLEPCLHHPRGSRHAILKWKTDVH